MTLLMDWAASLYSYYGSALRVIFKYSILGIHWVWGDGSAVKNTIVLAQDMSSVPTSDSSQLLVTAAPDLMIPDLLIHRHTHVHVSK